MSIEEILTSPGTSIQQEFVQEKRKIATQERVRRCKACRTTTTTTKEEVANHENEESDLVRSMLDSHVRSDPPTHYLEFNSRKTKKLSTNVAREMALFTIN
jgi:hypothetical protein